MSRPQRIGVTGGIGTGKSVVTNIFRVLNIPTYDADTRAKYLVNNDSGIRQAIIALLGHESFDSKGYNRGYVSSKVFSEPHLLESLNNIIHPAVAVDFENWVLDYPDKNYVIKEAALLFESGSYKSLDKIILVTAPLEIRIDRIKNRDHRSEEEIMNIINTQWQESKKIELSDYCIKNGPQDLLIPQVLDLHQKFSST